MAGVLGVPTMEYFPYALFNLINPLLAFIFAFTGFRVEHLGLTDDGAPENADTDP
jgi:NhaC family Na+:H+ antiporter